MRISGFQSCEACYYLLGSQREFEDDRRPAMTKYEVILYWSAEDDAFIAEVPELAGCAADGATRQEALENVETVIGEWIETARELGRAIPEPKGRLLFA